MAVTTQTKWYTARDVAELLGLSVAQVRSYAQAGLVRPERGTRREYRFSFQDLVLLRAAKDLIAARLPARRIRRALKTLQQQLPTGRSLSEMRIVAEGDRIVVHDAGAAWNPDTGQMQLDFTVAELAADAAPLARRAARAAQSSPEEYDADDWYDLGVELEAVSPDDAREAYLRALERDPEHADARVNVGRLLHEAGKHREAEAHYRRALDAAGGKHATAAFNLGVVLEDLRRPADAIAAYRKALAADPDFADAHYNLAGLYERIGEQKAALRHLRSYKTLSERA